MATVNSTSVALSSPIGAVDSSLALSGNTVTLKPAQPLVWGTHYQLNVAATLRGAGGGSLAAPYTAGFDTRMPTWSTVLNVTGSKEYMSPPQTAGAPNGDVLAVWSEIGANAVLQLTATRYNAATQTWGATTVIQGNNNRAESPVLSSDNAGNACVVWEESQDDGRYVIKAARYNAASGQWSVPATVSKPGEYSSRYSGVTAAINKTGSIIVAWTQYHNTNANQATIDTAYFDAASQQWTAAHSLQNSPVNTFFPTVAIDTNGNAMVLWSQAGPTAGVFLANAARYDTRSRNWSANTQLVADTNVSSSVGQFAFDAAGNAIATMSLQTPQSTGSIHVIRYTAASNSWGKAELMAPTYTNSTLSIDAAGNALLVWRTDSGTTDHGVASRRYQPSTGSWAKLPDVPTNAAIIATTNLPLAFDPAGNAVTSWVSYGPNSINHSLYTMRYNAAAGQWAAPVLITSGDPAIGQPTLTTDQSGQAMLLWPQYATSFYFSAVHLAYSRLSGR